MNWPAELARLNLDPTVPEAWIEVQAQLQKLQQQVALLELKNQKLVLELAHLKRLRFGTKSEAFSADQKRLFEDDADQDLAAIEAELAPPPADISPRPPRARAGRQTLPEHLERIDVRHEPESCACGHCQQELVKIGEDVSEQLDIEPARFFVIR